MSMEESYPSASAVGHYQHSFAQQSDEALASTALYPTTLASFHSSIAQPQPPPNVAAAAAYPQMNAYAHVNAPFIHSSSPLFLRHTTDRDRRILIKRSLMAELEASSKKRGYVWHSKLRRAPRERHSFLITHPDYHPICSYHLAALRIQRWWRRLPSERRHRPSMLKCESASNANAAGERQQQWMHPYDTWKQKVSKDLNAPNSRNLSMRGHNLPASYFLQTGQYHTQLGSDGKAYTLPFQDHCASIIQTCWLRRMKLRRMRAFAIRPMYTYAAIEIQRAYRAHLQRRGVHVAHPFEEDVSHGPHAPHHPPHAHDSAASIIQRCWRRFSQRRIYFYFRDLIRSRESADPYLLLRRLNPREGSMVAADKSSGLYLRFRLGGTRFPPIMYYKCFTSFSVTDVNAFAPRDYARDRKMQREAIHERTPGPASEQGQGHDQGSLASSTVDSTTVGAPSTHVSHPSQLAPTDRNYWYRRWENNGWRPLVASSDFLERDEVAMETASKQLAKVWHPNKLVRMMDVQRRRKLKKISWMKKMYQQAKLGPVTEEVSNRDPHDAADGEHDEEIKDGGMDSDEEEWQRWKAQSSASFHISASAPSSSSSINHPAVASVMHRLSSIDLNSPSALLDSRWEDEADELLEWCTELQPASFDAYHDSWLSMATTRPADQRINIDTTGAGAGSSSSTTTIILGNGRLNTRQTKQLSAAGAVAASIPGGLSLTTSLNIDQSLPATAQYSHVAKPAAANVELGRMDDGHDISLDENDDGDDDDDVSSWLKQQQVASQTRNFHPQQQY